MQPSTPPATTDVIGEATDPLLTLFSTFMNKAEKVVESYLEGVETPEGGFNALAAALFEVAENPLYIAYEDAKAADQPLDPILVDDLAALIASAQVPVVEAVEESVAVPVLRDGPSTVNL